MTDRPVSDLLERLSSSKADAAWSEFLELFSPLIMHIVRRYESDQRRGTDCFLHVCAALSDGGFRRLRSYRQEGAARFRTWLMAVVANLCVDWRRKKHGRYRPIRSVARLSELDQLVYRYRYVRGMPRTECLRALEPRYPDLTEQQLCEISARLFALLTPQHRWQLSLRTASAGPLDDGTTLDPEDAAAQLEEPGPGPEEITQVEQQHDRVAEALAQLPAEQRLLLRLRYEQDLTLAEVARLARLADPFRANRQIQAALAALADLMTGNPTVPGRKTP
jgi:RNA polymerase sigma factor (sigma-70 family)